MAVAHKPGFAEYRAKLMSDWQKIIDQTYDDAGDYHVVVWKDGQGYRHILHQTPKHTGKEKWQYSTATKDWTPWGHRIFDSREEALEEIIDARRGDPKFKLEERRKLMKNSGKNADLIALGREWLEHSPKARNDGPADLAGFHDPLDYVYASCIDRLLGRGVRVQTLAKEPTWDDQYGGEICDLCGKKWKGKK